MSGAAPTRELTLRAVVLGALLTVLFTAANVYLGLRIGLTFATSIPAAVISMAVLRLFPGATIHENNIVQTIASAAGTLSAIIFVLPGLVMIGWWTGFPYWQSVAVIALGGILGVMFSVPLRRALVTNSGVGDSGGAGSGLPYPEGVAAAEVLKVGAGIGGAAENAAGLRAILAGSAASAGYALLAKLGLVAEEASRAFRLGAGATSVSASFSLALIGVGHLVGLAVGAAMFVGLLVSWAILIPHYTAAGLPASVDLASFVGETFRHKVRFVGAGTIGIAAIWTLLRVVGPVLRGIRSALAAARLRARGQGEELALAERDLPIALVAAATVVLLAPIGLLLAGFARGGPVETALWPTLAVSLVFILLAGVVIAAVCGYMAGLIGASNSPISGTGILAALGIALILLAIFGPAIPAAASPGLVAYALFVTAIVFGVATISNDNLQDLKTGQLVGATPWRQQAALVLGVLFGAAVIPPLLDLLNLTFGFQGAPGAGPQALAAPQAALITAIAQGVLGGHLDWSLIGLGALIGLAAIIVDECLRKAGRGALPPLAVGMGIYLPMGLTLLVPLGALVGHWYERAARRAANPALHRRLGVLAATGLIAGESLFGVAFAGLAAARNRPDPLMLVADFGPALPVGIAVFAAAIALAYVRQR